jgi:hypothetical protein
LDYSDKDTEAKEAEESELFALLDVAFYEDGEGEERADDVG